jgi:methylmalonyl-CoA/ethylmalonyl-CoA epimerase
VQLGRLDHVGIAVSDLAAARTLYEQVLGLEVTHEEVIEDQGVHELLLRAGEAFVQLADVAATLTDLRTHGLEVIDPAPRIGSGGATIAFLHPKSMQGVLVELVEEGTGNRGER